MTPPRGPFTPEEFSEEMTRTVNGDGVLFARGGIAVSTDGVFFGVHVYHMVEGTLSEAMSGVVSRADWQTCRTLCLERFSAGVGSVSSIDRKALVWTDETPLFRAWHDGHVIWSLDAAGVLRGGEVALHRSNIDAIERYVSDDWEFRSVRARQQEGTPVDLVVERCTLSKYNYTYDHQELDDDTMWAFSFGRSLAESLERPHVDLVPQTARSW